MTHKINIQEQRLDSITKSIFDAIDDVNNVDSSKVLDLLLHIMVLTTELVRTGDRHPLHEIVFNDRDGNRLTNLPAVDENRKLYRQGAKIVKSSFPLEYIV